MCQLSAESTSWPTQQNTMEAKYIRKSIIIKFQLMNSDRSELKLHDNRPLTCLVPRSLLILSHSLILFNGCKIKPGSGSGLGMRLPLTQTVLDMEGSSLFMCLISNYLAESTLSHCSCMNLWRDSPLLTAHAATRANSVGHVIHWQ